MPDYRWVKGPTAGLTLRAGGRASVRQSRFGSTVSDWVQDTEEKIDHVFQLAARITVSQMQQMCPFKEGYLRSSLVVGVNTDFAPMIRTKKDGFGDYSPGAVAATLASARVGDRIAANYTMVYARRLEYGFVGTDSLGRYYNEAPRGWVRLAAQQWRANVEAAAEQVRTT